MSSQNFLSASLLPEPSSTPPPKRKYSQRQRDEREDEILAFGYESTIFNDQITANRIEKGEYLIPWKSLLDHHDMVMDRYDVRHLIDDNKLFAVEQVAILDKKLDVDRYADLYAGNDKCHNDDDSSRNRVTIPYDYDSENKRQKVDSEPLSELELDIISKYKISEAMTVPKTAEQVSIIEATAKEVCSASNANLLEIRIQVQNANNSLYAFLNKQDTLYPFYKYIAASISSSTGIKSGGNLVEYSDSDIENDEAELEPPSVVKDIIMKTAASIAKSDNSDMLEQRIRSMKSQDPRFRFLNVGNVYNAYYKSQIVEARRKTNKMIV